MGILKNIIDNYKKSNLTHIDQSDFNFYHKLLSSNINRINSHINQLTWYRKKDDSEDRVRLIERIKIDILDIERIYSQFIKEFKRISKIYDNITLLSHGEILKEASSQLKVLTAKKQLLRIQLEKVYNNFKNTIKSLNDKNLPMNQILAQMRRAFDFDSSKFKEVEDFHYYDANTQTIK